MSTWVGLPSLACDHPAAMPANPSARAMPPARANRRGRPCALTTDTSCDRVERRPSHRLQRWLAPEEKQDAADAADREQQDRDEPDDLAGPVGEGPGTGSVETGHDAGRFRGTRRIDREIERQLRSSRI